MEKEDTEELRQKYKVLNRGHEPLMFLWAGWERICSDRTARSRWAAEAVMEMKCSWVLSLLRLFIVEQTGYSLPGMNVGVCLAAEELQVGDRAFSACFTPALERDKWGASSPGDQLRLVKLVGLPSSGW